MHLILDTITASSSLTITKDRDTSFNYPARIETLSVVSSVSILSPVRAIDRFLAVCSVFARSLL
jgi:hypothetical protein